MDSSKTKEEALKKGKALQKRLGAGWKTHVFENLGWHYTVSALDGLLSVHGHSFKEGTKYFCMFTNSFPGTGSPGWYSHKSYEDPLDAVRKSFAIARKRSEMWAKLVAAFGDLPCV